MMWLWYAAAFLLLEKLMKQANALLIIHIHFNSENSELFIKTGKNLIIFWCVNSSNSKFKGSWIAPGFSPGGQITHSNSEALAPSNKFLINKFSIMPFIKIWVHLVWTTKNREPILTREFRSNIFGHIRENAEKKGIYIDFINGYLEHVHCLISLGCGQNIDKILMLLKGESSYWINISNLIADHFMWQDDYWAVGVGASHLVSFRVLMVQEFCFS